MVNMNVLEDNFFFDRFLGFLERFDEVNGTNRTEYATTWVEQKDYDSIYYYLKLCSRGSIVFLSHTELANMTEEDLLTLQDFSKKMAPLLDEERALYAEFAAYLGKT